MIMSENNSKDVCRTNMMSKEEYRIVQAVYGRFISCEEDGVWTGLDDLMEYFEYLTDNEIIVESQFKMKINTQKGIKCTQNHPPSDCFAPTILEAVEAIISLFDKTQSLHPKNRYILCYYMTLCELKLLVINES